MIEPVGRLFGEYYIRRIIARDEMVTTCLAQHEPDGEYVTLSLLPQACSHNEQALRRFDEIMRQAVSVQHPRIVPVLDYGIIRNYPYVSRPYFSSGTLWQQIRITGPLPLKSVLSYFSQIADAIDHVHQQGMVHLGLTPHAIWRDSESRLFISDVGIAEFCYEAIGLTRSLLSYMPPEIFLQASYDNSVDIYALGIMLYLMLTGELPYKGMTYTQLMQAHLRKPVPSICNIRSDLPSKIQEIIKQSVAKTTTARYLSVRDMAADLESIFDGKDTKRTTSLATFATLPGSGPLNRSRSKKTSRLLAHSTDTHQTGNLNVSHLFTEALTQEQKDPAVAIELYRQIANTWPQFAQGSVIDKLDCLEREVGIERTPAMLVEANHAKHIGDWQRVEEIASEILVYEPDHAEAQRLLEHASIREAARSHYQTAQTAYQEGDPKAAFLLLRELYRAIPQFDDPRRLLTIWSPVTEYIVEKLTIDAHEGAILSLAFSPDSSLLVSGSTDKLVRLWRIEEEGDLYGQIDRQYSWISYLTFTPDGTFLFSGVWDGEIKIWAMPECTCRGVIAGLTGQVQAIACARHAPGIVAVACGYFLTIWGFPSGENINLLREVDKRAIMALDYSPKEPLLICGMDNGDVRIRSASDSQYPIVHSEQVHEGTVYAVSCSPDGSYVASASRDQTAKITTIDGGNRLAEMRGHEGAVLSLAFSPDGSLLATGGRDCSVRLWRVEDGSALKVLHGHSKDISKVCFSPDGRLLASADKAGYIKIWSMA
ncbi:MAG: serine/threonine protein kinase [Anaerolineae bacterium]|nr:serine/threonine protein kinase [Anaerolineae bacterium]